MRILAGSYELRVGNGQRRAFLPISIVDGKV
jgi:hypothetical protein